MQVKGFLEQDGRKLDAPRIIGKWDDALYAEMADGTQQQLWKINPAPELPTRWVVHAALPARLMRLYLLHKLYATACCS